MTVTLDQCWVEKLRYPKSNFRSMSSSCSKVFYDKVALKYFAIFTRNDLQWGPFYSLQLPRPETLL